MDVLLVTFATIVGLFLAETRLASKHTRDLRQDGAIEPAGDPWQAIFVLYPLALVTMAAEGVRRADIRLDRGWHLSLDAQSWFAAGLLLFVAAKALKYW